MKVIEIEYGGEKYKSSIFLRNKILRDPIGLIFTDQDLLEEKDSFHIGCFDDSESQLQGCCFLTPHMDDQMKLRQMAVFKEFQNQGVGRCIMQYAELFSKEKGYLCLYLHARKEAVGFYLKLGYKLISSEFIEVGIPHFEMIKKI